MKACNKNQQLALINGKSCQRFLNFIPEKSHEFNQLFISHIPKRQFFLTFKDKSAEEHPALNYYLVSLLKEKL